VGTSKSSSRAKPLSAAEVFDLPGLAERQIASDRQRTQRFPDLFARKAQRMSASPLAFLRGAAPLFYDVLAARPDLSDGPPGEGWLVGDLHLENFGAYRPDVFAEHEAGKKRPAVFNLNDFDDAIIGPWRFDLLRLMTSLLLGGRELGASGPVALELVDHLFDAWLAAVFDDVEPSRPPAPVEALLEQVRGRTRTALLDARTKIVDGQRRFIRGPRYSELEPHISKAVPAAFAGYLDSVQQADRPDKGSLVILDAALRIAGTGSLGGLRIAVLVEGKGGPNGAWIFDLKEQGAPSASVLLPTPSMAPATRVCTAFRACVELPPRVMGTTQLGKVSMFGRRLAPQEDKLVLRHVKGDDLPALARYLGALLGVAHRRGATRPATSRWSNADRDHLRGSAVTLAAIHEGAYLTLCNRMRALAVASPA
jgi:uncharacterized protein (DUF2252 family)